MVLKSNNFNPREMMERAIVVMRQSVPEQRTDGSPSPKVGALLVRSDGSVVTASRGELREGNHAEYILLERKCLSECLDGSILFTTLEPCLNRNHPKRGCARHIVNARIREVYIGVEDDNPAVSGKGIEYLRRHGVKIEFFDRDLQELILQENKTFLRWARKQIVRQEEPAIKLSKYEDALVAVEWNDLSKNALSKYREKAGIRPKVDSLEFKRLLHRQGLLVGESNALMPSGFGTLLFGERPRDVLPHAGILAYADLPNGEIVRSEFGEALVLIPNLLVKWLNQVLPSVIDRSHMERKEGVNLPFEMIREAVVNALVHRDYSLDGQKCQLIVNSDVVIVKSPGKPVPPITLEKLNNFSAPMNSRNPQLHYVFARMGLAEEQGFGLEKSLKRKAEELSLPLPSFVMEDDYLVLTIYRNAHAASKTLSATIRNSMSKSELAGWDWISTKNQFSTQEYMKAMDLANRTAKNHINKFTSLGLLLMRGAGPSTYYQVLQS